MHVVVADNAAYCGVAQMEEVTDFSLRVVATAIGHDDGLFAGKHGVRSLIAHRSGIELQMET